MVNGAYELIMAPVVSTFFGTPFAAPLLRLLGCKIGRHCYIGSALFSEFDLVKIGDRVALNSGAVIQNHLFEDRIMKSSFLTIEDGCSVGNMSVVLYDLHMMRGATLGPLSLLMKGEVMPQSFRGHGIPTVQASPGAPVHHINSDIAQTVAVQASASDIIAISEQGNRATAILAAAVVGHSRLASAADELTLARVPDAAQRPH